MRHTITEITLDVDRVQGRRIFQLIRADGEERITIEVTCASNVSPPDCAVQFENCNHPHVNSGLVDAVFDLLIALRENPYSVDLTPPQHS